MADFERVDFDKIVSELFQLVQSAETPILVGTVGSLSHTDSAEAAFRKLVKGIKRVRAALPDDVDLADCGPQELSDLRQLIERLDEFEAIYVGGNKGQAIAFPCDEQDVAILRDSLKAIQRTRNLEWMDSEGTIVTPKQTEAKRGPTAETSPGSTRNLKPSEEKAYGQFVFAIQSNPGLVGKRDLDVYDWIAENQLEDGESLPIFSTWQRQLRSARNFHGEQKNTPAIGRATGKSIVRADEI